jgi:hypothetical protein
VVNVASHGDEEDGRKSEGDRAHYEEAEKHLSLFLLELADVYREDTFE